MSGRQSFWDAIHAAKVRMDEERDTATDRDDDIGTELADREGRSVTPFTLATGDTLRDESVGRTWRYDGKQWVEQLG